MFDEIKIKAVTMNSLTNVDTLATDSVAIAAEAVQESLNVLDLAMKGGWIMIVLAVLSVVGIYIFFERYAVLR
jgi:biopolymer transport protein ExbB